MTTPEPPPETMTRTPARAPEVTDARRVRHRVASSLHRLEHALERPVVGGSFVGGLMAVAVGLWGPTEAVLGAVAGLTAYRFLKHRRQTKRASAPASSTEPISGFSG